MPKLFVLIAAVVLAASCTSVEPWERERLSHDCMQVPVDADQARTEAKTEATREGAAGGIQRTGGGCGCN